MSFSIPQWSSTKEIYIIKILSNSTFEYTETRQSSGANFCLAPSNESQTFKKVLEEIANQIFIKGKSWFASPIKPLLFLKKVRNIFAKVVLPENYGNTYLLTWTPYLLNIHSNYYELLWNVSLKKNILPSNSNSIEFSDELNEPVQEKIVIQSNPAEICELELVEAPPLTTMEISSRANMKKKIRQTRLRAAILALKAEKMAEKYFRRYGNLSGIEYESDLSLSEKSEESEEDEDQ